MGTWRISFPFSGQRCSVPGPYPERAAVLRCIVTADAVRVADIESAAIRRNRPTLRDRSHGGEIMNTEMIGMIAAGVGVVFSAAYVILGVIGIRMLRDRKERLERR